MKLHYRHLLRLFSLAALFLTSACTSGHTQLRRWMSSTPTSEPPSKSILFIGNSYSFEVPKTLRKIAAKYGTNIRVEQVTNGGWTLAQHVENEETLAKIREGGWDFVVIQEQSRIPSLALSRSRKMFPQVRKLADEARAKGAVPVLYQTWGYRDGDPHRIGFGRDDFHAMTRRLREGYKAAAREAGGVKVVPVGDAWEREMKAGRGHLLFMPDGSHPTAHGDAITAQTFFDSLFPSENPPTP